jgi:hypothetical protein
MPRVKIGTAPPDQKTIAVEIARLRDLDAAALRARWHTVLGRLNELRREFDESDVYGNKD